MTDQIIMPRTTARMRYRYLNDGHAVEMICVGCHEWIIPNSMRDAYDACDPGESYVRCATCNKVVGGPEAPTDRRRKVDAKPIVIEYRMRYRYVEGHATELICVPCFDRLPEGLQAKYEPTDPNKQALKCHGCGAMVGGAR